MQRHHVDALLTAAAVVTALTVLFGALWWLVSPRVSGAIETTCRRAVADALIELEDRVGRLEHATTVTHHPGRLVELADLLALIQEHAPTDQPAWPVQRRPQPRTEERTNHHENT